MANIFGFTLLRNAVKYDYCFQESLLSLSGLVKYIVLALGNSEDDTELRLKSIPNLQVIPTYWDESLRKSGLILSQQTNVALDILRQTTKNDLEAWGFYLQADEVIHENDYTTIKNDIDYANSNGYDAVRFRYFHFWQHHNQVAIGKKWYPLEVRAVKLNSNIRSEKDAQGFSGIKRIYDSEAFIYHYGHVRKKDLYELKKKDFHKLYQQDSEIAKAQKKEEKKYKEGKVLSYYGSHPAVMKTRIDSFGDIYQLTQIPEIWIKNNSENDVSVYFDKINSSKVNLVTNRAECKQKDKLIVLFPTFWDNLFCPSKVNTRPESRLGDDWTFKTYLMLKLSEKFIGSNL